MFSFFDFSVHVSEFKYLLSSVACECIKIFIILSFHLCFKIRLNIRLLLETKNLSSLINQSIERSILHKNIMFGDEENSFFIFRYYSLMMYTHKSISKYCVY